MKETNYPEPYLTKQVESRKEAKKKEEEKE